MTTREEAARARAEGMAARADRPRQRRATEDQDSPKPRLSGALLRAETDQSDDRIAFRGVASVTETPYTVWDMFGEYVEIVDARAFDATLAREDLDVPLVIGHDQLRRMARTTNGTLRLAATEEGLSVEADLDPADGDVAYIVPKLRAGLIDEMSFAFRIEAGQWSPDYTEYRVTQVDLHRGDVAVVGWGANPATFAQVPARSDAEAGQVREESPAADAPADDLPAEHPIEREDVPMDDTQELAAEVVEPTPTHAVEVREDAEAEALRARVADLEEQIRIRHNAEEAQRDMNTPAYDQVARVGREERTYRPDQDARGGSFVRDAVMAHLGDYSASERLHRHMAEERIERGDQLQRTAGTSAFAGLVVPQYLTDLVAPAAKAARPLADAIRNLPLPEQGMSVNISRITTATSSAVQTEATSVSETDIDDTILSPSVLTIAGSQTVTRQAVERGTGTLDVVLEDLARGYAATLDSTLITQGTYGLSAVATGITWTDNTDPTAAELYPKLLQGVAAVEAALLDQDPGDTIIVMHSRRWYWLNAALASTRPLLNQSIVQEQFGANFIERYGAGFRGVIAGIPVIVDNNIATNGGAATNQDEVYVLSSSQSFLWEDPNAPMMIRTETGPSVKSLGVDVVVYGYAAYTFSRYSHAQKISGTGLVTPTFA